MIWLVAFIVTIPTANWLIGNIGTTCLPDGPCLVPVGFGLMAPSGVLMIGAALVLRDLVHESIGWKWAAGGILFGAALSGFVAPPALAIASGLAFLLSEAADMAVYSPLRTRRLWLAVLASGAAGSVIDSAAFLYLAFGSLDFMPGQIVGKIWATAAAVPALLMIRRRSS